MAPAADVASSRPWIAGRVPTRGSGDAGRSFEQIDSARPCRADAPRAHPRGRVVSLRRRRRRRRRPPTSRSSRRTSTGATIDDFTFLVSEDNAGQPDADPPTERPGVRPLPSYIPLVAAGDQDSATVTLDSPGDYLVTVKAADHKLWGKHFSLPLPAGREWRGRRPAGAVPAEAREARRARVPRPASGERRPRFHAALSRGG